MIQDRGNAKTSRRERERERERGKELKIKMWYLIIIIILAGSWIPLAASTYWNFFTLKFAADLKNMRDSETSRATV